MNYEEALSALEVLYAELPSLRCQRRCQESCGVIVMSRVEWLQIQRKLGYKPKGKPSLVCPMLKRGQCSVHPIRPIICRLWGLMGDPRMRCPWGCQPDRWLTEEDGHSFLMRAEAITEQVFPQSTVPLAERFALRPWTNAAADERLLQRLKQARMQQETRP